jgi:hypothetical protein
VSVCVCGGGEGGGRGGCVFLTKVGVGMQQQHRGEDQANA